VLLRGVIDESYNVKVFTLSCLIAQGSKWMWLSNDWKKVLKRWNSRLKTEGRSPISRYHAADCSNRVREFEGWSVQEQIDFTVELIGVLKRYDLDMMAFSLDLREFAAAFPYVKKGDETLISLYRLATRFLVLEMGERYCQLPTTRLALIHDRCAYDGVMVDIFRMTLEQESFQYRGCFSTLVSMAWEECIPLQPADLIAYENFKDSLRQLEPRDRRKSLEAILDLGKLGGHTRWVGREGMLAIKDVIENKVTA